MLSSNQLITEKEHSELIRRVERITMKKFLLLFVVLGLITSCNENKATKSTPTEKKEVSSEPSAYQAVFINNSQVYYGKLEETKGQFYSLKEVYIIQMIPQGKDQPPKPRLERFGNEVIGLVNELKINKDQIMFIQDLADDSKVLEGINKIKSNKGAALDTDPQVPAQQQVAPQQVQQPKQAAKPSKPEKEAPAKPADKGQHGVR
jgi:hypothetical protein